MIIEELLNKNPDARVQESYKKACDVQEKLNASITLIDPTEQLENCNEGKLFKIPYALKDNFNFKGVLATSGCKILDNHISIYDATVVKKLKEAGAVCVSKASMDELAMGGTNLTSLIGPCHNPYDLNRISGGSSGGSAVLVASGVVPFAIGSDTGDSVRKPASLCGVIGVKPTYGRISRYGVIPYASSLDHVGYFTNSVKDSALLLEVLAGRDDLDVTSSFEPVPNYSELLNDGVKGKKVLVFKNVTNAISSKEVLDSFDKVVNGLKDRGAIVKEVEFDHDLMKSLFPVYYVISNCEATANHSNLDGIRFGHRVEGESMEEVMINSRTRGFGPLIKKRFVVGSYSLFEENQEKVLRKAQKIRRLIADDIMKELKDADCLIAPASGSGAPLITGNDSDALSDEYLVAENHLVIGNFLGLPSMTLPMGSVEGLPVGVNITCNAFKEVDMFNIAKDIEEITDLKNNTKEDF